MIASQGVRCGQNVYAADGARLGRVSHCHDSGFVVVKGLVFAKGYPVFYDEVLHVDGDAVRLRFTADAFLSEEESEPWDPPRDPVGSAGGTDLEPLRAGMAEVDEVQERLRAGDGGTVATIAHRAGGWAVWARLARPQRGDQPVPPRVVARIVQAGLDEHAPRATAAELGHRIAEEVEDYEQEAGCARRDEEELRAAAIAAARVQRRIARAARRWGGTHRARPGRRAARPSGANGIPRSGWPSGGGRIADSRSAFDTLAALRRLETHVRRSGLEPPLLELVRLRASQLDGCAPCVELHGDQARRRGVTAQRLDALTAWDTSPLFTERERAALAWTEAVTQVGAARADEDVYRRARAQLGERGLVDLTMAIVALNGWNRLAIAFASELDAYQLP